MEKQQVSCEARSDDQVPHPTSKAEPRHSLEEAHFCFGTVRVTTWLFNRALQHCCKCSSNLSISLPLHFSITHEQHHNTLKLLVEKMIPNAEWALLPSNNNGLDSNSHIRLLLSVARRAGTRLSESPFGCS